MAVALPKRSELDPRYTWNLENIYPNLDAWKSDFKRVEEALPGLEAYKGHLGDSAQKLLEYFRAQEETFERVGHVFVYANLLSDGDTTNQDALAIKDQGRNLYTRYSAAVAFAEPELLSIPTVKMEQFMSEAPELNTYRHMLDMLHKREGHVRSPEVEAVDRKSTRLNSSHR